MKYFQGWESKLDSHLWSFDFINTVATYLSYLWQEKEAFDLSNLANCFLKLIKKEGWLVYSQKEDYNWTWFV